MKTRIFIWFVVAFVAVLSLSFDAVAQNIWLDQKPLPNWSSRSRAILKTKKMSPADLGQCRSQVRAAALPADRLLVQNGWTLVGPAQVFGRTSVVTVAESFDGMCRPLGFQTLVFVGNRVAGTLSPGPMNSRTDGYLTNVRLFSETYLGAEYARYRESDPLCCPYKIESVSFNIKPDGANFLLTPDQTKTDVGGSNNSSSSGDGGSAGSQPSPDSAALKNTVWRWESSETTAGQTTVDKPENYQLDFTADGRVNVTADCNRGRGTYKPTGNNLTLFRYFSDQNGVSARFARQHLFDRYRTRPNLSDRRQQLAD